jgi:hypothetical protein
MNVLDQTIEAIARIAYSTKLETYRNLHSGLNWEPWEKLSSEHQQELIQDVWTIQQLSKDKLKAVQAGTFGDIEDRMFFETAARLLELMGTRG